MILYSDTYCYSILLQYMISDDEYSISYHGYDTESVQILFSKTFSKKLLRDQNLPCPPYHNRIIFSTIQDGWTGGPIKWEY